MSEPKGKPLPPTQFELMVCESRSDGLWPVVRLKDAKRRSFMEPGPMGLMSGEKSLGLIVEPLRRALEGLLSSSYGGPVREMLEGLVGRIEDGQTIRRSDNQTVRQGVGGLEGEQDFDRVWDELAAEGHCDSRGGAEYERVKQAWGKGLGPVVPLRGFILVQANVGPDGGDKAEKGNERKHGVEEWLWKNGRRAALCSCGYRTGFLPAEMAQEAIQAHLAAMNEGGQD